MSNIALKDLIKQLIQKPKEEKPRPKPITVRKIWNDEAIVLLVQEVHCLSCQAIHISPSHVPFLVRWHPKLGRNLTAINHKLNSAEWIGLEKRIETISLTSQMCQQCFDPQALDLQIRQLDLEFPETPDSFTDPEFSSVNSSEDEEMEV